MKNIIFFVTAFVFLPFCLMGQGGEAIDRFFEKYSGTRGITSVYISSKMFSMFSQLAEDDPELDDITNRLKSIRIISVEDPSLNEKINFYEELRKTTDFSSYEDLMVVNESNNITRFLVRYNGKIISELLVISGGSQGNTMISIKGDLDLKNISELSKTMNIDDLDQLEKLDSGEKKDQK